VAQGWPQPELLAEPTRPPGPMGWLGGQGNPFFAVIAAKPMESEGFGQLLGQVRLNGFGQIEHQ